ncbi:MAG: peroxide stress protein YaaA [Acidimicrobiales bacterium]|nr:peroxide stress protein YaaA [Acidimicrobiales bacterium]
MLILLSPAKSLDYETPLATKKHSQPRMLERATELVEVLAPMGPQKLAKMMGISAPLAEENAARFLDWSTPFTTDNARPAVLAFNGDVYRGLDATSFSERDFTHAQKTIRILSGLYGVLRPLDLMQPYRLEMGSKLKTSAGRDLYQFWGSDITDILNKDLAESPGARAVVNLASNEYFSSVKASELDGTLLSPRFLDGTEGEEPKVKAFFAKQARGAMAGWIVRNRVSSMSGLRDFDGMGYRYDPARSTRAEPAFTRVS